MILAGGKAGNPWHGVWTEDGLTLPNDTVLDLPVAIDGGPNGWPAFYPIPEPWLTFWGPRHGDCLLVRVPDVPAPDTSAAEEAVGMTWLNYAMISGANRLLYGVPIGKATWIYLDDNDQPWLVEMLAVTETQQIYRFRFSSNLVFGENVTEVLFEYGVESDINVEPAVLEASETGRRMAWALHQYSETIGHQLDPMPQRFILTGVPGVDLDISEGTAATSFSNPDLIWGDNGPWTGNTYPAGHLSRTVLLPPYWMYDGDDEISLRFVEDYDASAWPLVENETWHVDRTLSGTLSILTPFGSFDVAFTSVISEPSFGVFSFAFTTDDWSYSNDYTGFLPWVYTVRQTNKVVEVVFSLEEVIDGTNLDVEVFSVCRVLPDRFEATGVTTTLDQIPGYMTYHPVTKELLESSSPVCFM